MKLGLRKLEWIDAADVDDYSCATPGGSVNLSAYIKEGAAFAELPFISEVANMEEEWLLGEDGMYSSATFSSSIRAEKAGIKPTLMALRGKKAIWKVTLIDGQQRIIGSPEFIPTFTFTDSMSGISSSEFAITISNDSVHGILVNAE